MFVITKSERCDRVSKKREPQGNCPCRNCKHRRNLDTLPNAAVRGYVSLYPYCEDHYLFVCERTREKASTLNINYYKDVQYLNRDAVCSAWQKRTLWEAFLSFFGWY